MSYGQEIDAFQELGEKFEKLLRLKTFPVAIRLITKEDEIPDGFQRPLRDLDRHIHLCQGFHLARYEGASVAMLRRDNWCLEPVIGFGLQVPPQLFMDGTNRYPKDVANLEAGRNYAEEFPKLETGKYVGILMAPLTTVSFKPDVIRFYVNSNQLSLLLLAHEYKDGRSLPCRLSSHAACVFGTVPVIQTRECCVAVPCRGEHFGAMTGDDEMIFTCPQEHLSNLLVALNYLKTTGSKIPKGYQFRREYPQPPAYDKISEIMGFRDEPEPRK